LLGLDDSWRVESVDLQIEDRRVEICLSHVGSGVFCPECSGVCGLADHADERRWLHKVVGDLPWAEELADQIATLRRLIDG